MGETLVTDGRTSRAAKTRTAVVDALLTLIDGGNLRPTAREIADEAGVSLRSVYVHFDDVESLFVAAAARHHERMEPMRGPVVDTGPFEVRLSALVRARRRSFDAGAQVLRAALYQEPFSPVLHAALDAGRQALRSEVERVFAPELGAVPATERVRVRATIEILTGFGTWDALRTHEQLSADEAVCLVIDMVRATLAIWNLPSAVNGDPPPKAAPRAPD